MKQAIASKNKKESTAKAFSPNHIALVSNSKKELKNFLAENKIEAIIQTVKAGQRFQVKEGDRFKFKKFLYLVVFYNYKNIEVGHE